MAFLEWRKFNFFDLKKNIDNGKLAEILKGAPLAAYTCGNSHIILCDNLGYIYSISRQWNIITFKAYENSLTHAISLRHLNLLITVGEEELNSQYAIIKLWNLSKLENGDIPNCLKTIRKNLNNIQTVTALCASSSPPIIALGFSDGTVWLRRGDFNRDRSVKLKSLKDVYVPINGLAIKTTARQTYLYVATSESVFLYNVSVKEKEFKVSLDSIGCAIKCCILAETLHESHFMIARDDAIYCYTPDGRGPCYAIDGEKVMLDSFRSYLVIISKKSDHKSVQQNNSHLVTVLDIQNKFIVFTAAIDNVVAVVNEFGSFYIIDGQNSVYHLSEKDLQSKLNLLFKKNLYDVAIRIAKSQQYDTESLIDIFRQYGDHLYTKGDHQGAVEQYVKTIGKLEASYVIKKFLDSQYIDKLTQYLQALHKAGVATEDHTTLLLNCYTKLNHTDKLKEFILNKDKDIDFDIDIAIKVCRQVSPEDALILAKKYLKHNWYLKIQIEDFKKFSDALCYLKSLNYNDSLVYMKKYATIFMQNIPDETTNVLKYLCTYIPEANGVQNAFEIDIDDFDDQYSNTCEPEEFLSIFINYPLKLVEFLEHLLNKCSTTKLSRVIYDALIDNYLNLWYKETTSVEKDMTKVNDLEKKLLKLFQNPDIDYDKNQALILCQNYNFTQGVLFLFEEAKQYQHMLNYLMKSCDEQSVQSVLICCKKYGHQDPNLWLQALWHYTHKIVNTEDELCHYYYENIIPQILDAIASECLLSPLLVLDALCASRNITLGIVNNYLKSAYNAENEIIEREYENIEKNRANINKLRELIEKLRDQPCVFQNSRCSACHHQLELPTVHFMCQHSFHQHCFQSFSDNEDCPACQPTNEQLSNMIKLQQTNKDLHETFHNQLEKADDAFTLLSEYFGRSVFNKITVLTNDDTDNNSLLNIQNLSEENKFNKTFTTTTNGILDSDKLEVPENGTFSGIKITSVKSQNNLISNKPMYSTSLDSSRIFDTKMAQQKSNSSINKLDSTKNFSLKSVESINQISANPFEDDDDDLEFSASNYDERKNPFSDANKPTKNKPYNPFEDDDDEDSTDYDKNLNPFS